MSEINSEMFLEFRKLLAVSSAGVPTGVTDSEYFFSANLPPPPKPKKDVWFLKESDLSFLINRHESCYNVINTNKCT